MSVIFGSWKYTLKNLWYVLPFAIVPAIFLALSLDFHSFHFFISKYFTGSPQLGFLTFLSLLSIFRFDGWLGAIYDVCAFISIVLFSSMLLFFVEKHMRLGRRSPNGLLSQFGSAVRAVLFIAVFYLVLYEIWAIIIAALLFATATLKAAPVVYTLHAFIIVLGLLALFFIFSMFYLWLPCKLMTGFKTYDVFQYSYRLGVTVRWRLVLAFALHYTVVAAALLLASLSNYIVFLAVAFFVYLLMFPDFIVRMETVYFKADKLEREDVRRKEYC